MSHKIILSVLLSCVFVGCDFGHGSAMREERAWLKERALYLYSSLGELRTDEDRLGRREYIKALLQAETDGCFDKRFGNGETLLIKAVLFNDGEVVKKLLSIDCFADVAATNNLGQSALSMAIERNYDEIVASMLKVGAPVNVKDRNGVTPLMQALRVGNADMIKKLLKCGADSKARDVNGKTAADYALDNGKSNLIELL